MATSLEITNSFLSQLKVKIDDVNVTADVLSNLLNQYQTITNMIRDGYQFSEAELADLPATLALQMQNELDSVLATMPLLGKYNLIHCLRIDSPDLNTFSETGFFRVSDPVNAPVATSWGYLLSMSHGINWGVQIFISFFDDRVFIRRYVESNGFRVSNIWKEFTLI